MQILHDFIIVNVTAFNSLNDRASIKRYSIGGIQQLYKFIDINRFFLSINI